MYSNSGVRYSYGPSTSLLCEYTVYPTSISLHQQFGMPALILCQILWPKLIYKGPSNKWEIISPKGQNKAIDKFDFLTYYSSHITSQWVWNSGRLHSCLSTNSTNLTDLKPTCSVLAVSNNWKSHFPSVSNNYLSQILHRVTAVTGSTLSWTVVTLTV